MDDKVNKRAEEIEREILGCMPTTESRVTFLLVKRLALLEAKYEQLKDKLAYAGVYL